MKENDKTTYVEKHKRDKSVSTHALDKARELKDQIKESSIIVKGEVLKVLPPVETEDLLDSGQKELVEGGIKFIHSDVVIKVNEYLGDKTLPYDEIVVRHPGGRNYVHLSSFEDLTVGEKVILFRLEQPEKMPQIPEGYDKDQYFLLGLNSKFVSHDDRVYKADFGKMESYDVDEIRRQAKKIKGE